MPISIVVRGADEKVNWLSSVPFFLLHLLPLGALWTGVSWFDVALCVALYYIRMFFVTAGYHRYFSHRGYKMGRVMQFLMAFGATTCGQKGVLWWAANHRHHHRFSDTDEDIHSPLKGFWWSHVGWILCDKYKDVMNEYIKDFAKFPELRWLQKYNLVPVALLGAFVLLVFGPSAFFIGFALSTVLLYHGTFTVNSLAHVFGRRRYATTDTSRNSFLISLLTLGEGWHNNHHYYAASARQGFFWWEIDVSYYVLKVLSWFGLVWDLRQPPARVLTENLIREGALDAGIINAHLNRIAQTLTETQREAGDFYEHKKRLVEEFVEYARARTLSLAEVTRETMEEFVETTKTKADDFANRTRETAGNIVRLSSGPLDAQD
ncbi:acyl-CoA desaturase [bacterium]|nr:acyl-CoA desaturase [bacterium]